MCCFLTTLVLFGPRAALVIWALINPAYVLNAMWNSWLWLILGTAFLPSTTLMYLIVYPGGLSIINWLFLGLAFFFDIAAHTGGAFGNRDRITSYT
ncbi:MAG TPA: hypothetical protein VFI27_02865 [candidate division Zixibacteria bacterium]|nr:hypothetical protein [candidate division Zixibacteria bacterium]